MIIESARILVVDDEQAIRTAMVTVLEREGFDATSTASGEEAIAVFDSDPFDVVITDIRMPGMSGVDVMRHVKERSPDTMVLLMTAHASLETAIQAVRDGASDYFTKPVRFENLILKIKNLLRLRAVEWENRVFRIEQKATGKVDEILGDSRAIDDVKQSTRRMGTASGNVLIMGESGTGKELVARAVHAASPDRSGAFVPVNCGSIPATLIESTLYGYKKGAFTGADNDRDGVFQEARRGTLFLDEVAELPLEMQPSLLRAIESNEVRPVGSPGPVSIDVRIVAATNRNIEQMVADGAFREDLFFRLNVFSITVPPLRERVPDISIIASAFLKRYRREIPSPAKEISDDAMAALERYPWRGNVRELQNVIQRALITADRSVIDSALIERLLGVRGSRDHNLKRAQREFERHHISRVLDGVGGDKQLAAERLGISLASLYAKLKS